MRSDAVWGRDSANDEFLEAPIDADRKDRLLSVLTALARLDLDPWQEAEALRRLPREAAILRLASLIAKLPDASPILRNPQAIAARLIALLPTTSRPETIARPERADGIRNAARLRALVVLFYLMLVAVILMGRFEAPAPPSVASDACNPLGVCDRAG